MKSDAQHEAALLRELVAEREALAEAQQQARAQALQAEQVKQEPK